MKQVLAFLLLLLFVTSCSTVEEVVEETVVEEIPSNILDGEPLDLGPPPRIQVGEAKGEIYSESRDDTVNVFINYQFYTPQFSSNVMDSVFKDSVNKIIQQEVIGETMAEGQGVFDQLTIYFFESSLDSFIVMAQDEIDELGSNLWGLEIDIWIKNFDSYVEVSSTGWSYTGGAHGNSHTSYWLINKEDGRLLDASDFFTDIEKLEEIMLPYFRKQNEIPADQTLEDYGYWIEGDDLHVNSNFYFEHGKVFFYYDTYEIAPYAGGPSEVYIPLSQLTGIYNGKK